MINAEQFAEWKEHPVTKEIFTKLEEIKENLKEQLANGNTLGVDASATHGLTNLAVGNLRGIEQLLNISFDEAESTDDIDERSGY